MTPAHEAHCEVRQATQADASGILDCLRSAFAAYQAHYSEAGYLDTVLTPETLEERFKAMTVFVAIIPAAGVVGTIAFGPADQNEGHLRGMAVRPEWQGRGIAVRLLEAAERELRNGGCSCITLDTTEPLVRAIQFYEKRGYRPSGKVGDFFGMPLFEYVKAL
ncbi:MAG TPA: GNAT family N-acetyltransferase [Terriglobia bacterium]|nr:GNAT family N-acetyltransferase [Terriglobia bacterium]